MNQLNILMEVLTRTEKYSANLTNKRWKFSEGISLYINPPFKCPLCKGSFPTNRIWLLDEINKSLKGCWRLDGNPIKGEFDSDDNYRGDVPHPHADLDGACMGNTKSLVELLFLGIRPGTHYYSTNLWLIQVGHGDCPEL